MAEIDYKNIGLSDFEAIIAKVYHDFYPDIHKEIVKYNNWTDTFYFIDCILIARHHYCNTYQEGIIYIESINNRSHT